MNYIDTETGEYPLTEYEIKQRNPQVSFPTPFESARYRPVAQIPQPSCLATQTVVEGTPTNMGTHWEQTWRILDLPASELPQIIAEAKERRYAEVNALRDAKLAEGTPFIFSDGPGVIQTRDLIDARNIQANVAAAQILHAQGVTDPVMEFRDEADVTHYLTPQEMIDMGLVVMTRGKAIYAASWTHKDAIKALSTLEEVMAYDITTGWP